MYIRCKPTVNILVVLCVCIEAYLRGREGSFGITGATVVGPPPDANEEQDFARRKGREALPNVAHDSEDLTTIPAQRRDSEVHQCSEQPRHDATNTPTKLSLTRIHSRTLKKITTGPANP